MTNGGESQAGIYFALKNSLVKYVFPWFLTFGPENGD
jgi:hypothetical protein